MNLSRVWNFFKRPTGPDITVVLTVYNNSDYVSQAVKSIKRQSFRNFEVISIDDCSSDTSVQELETAIKGDRRFRIVRHSSNMGVSTSWNTAIEQARGTYLVSVDGDDFIDRNTLRVLHREIVAGDFDIVAAGFRICSQSGKKISSKRFENEIFTLDQDAFSSYFNLIKSSFWGKIWKKSLFLDNGIRFPSGLYYQDLATTPRVLSFAKRVKIIDNVLFNYRQHASSTTNRMSAKHISDYFEVFSILRDHFLHLGSFERVRGEFEKAINDNLAYHIENIRNARAGSDERLEEYIQTIERKRGEFMETLDRPAL